MYKFWRMHRKRKRKCVSNAAIFFKVAQVLVERLSHFCMMDACRFSQCLSLHYVRRVQSNSFQNRFDGKTKMILKCFERVGEIITMWLINGNQYVFWMNHFEWCLWIIHVCIPTIHISTEHLSRLWIRNQVDNKQKNWWKMNPFSQSDLSMGHTPSGLWNKHRFTLYCMRREIEVMTLFWVCFHNPIAISIILWFGHA